MDKKLLTIYTPGPGGGIDWIEEFEESLIKAGLDTSSINSLHRCDRETASSAEARELFHRLDADTRYKIHLLLAPEMHKHYMRSIATTTYALATNENSMAVYDKTGLPDYDDTRGRASVMSVDTLLHMWNEKFPGRIFSREEAIQHLRTILPMREESQEAVRR